MRWYSTWNRQRFSNPGPCPAMDRRGYLTSAATAGTLAVAGCLEQLGFEEESIWRNPPMVEDRPDAVYIPPAVEEMGTYGSDMAGPYAVSLTYTVPHRFWIVSEGRERVEVTDDDTHHLMCQVWDPQTDTVLPADLSVTLEGPGEDLEFTPWPMISQRMGVHYGDNVALPEEGRYSATVTVGPLEVAGHGALADFEGTERTTFAFTYEHDDIHDLAFDVLDEDEWGERDALSVMEHDDHGHDDAVGHPAVSVGPPVEELPGTRLGTERSADAAVSAFLQEDGPDGGRYLAVTLRTPHTDSYLPFASIQAETGGQSVPLEEAIDEDRGHHYGATLENEPGEAVTVTVVSPPTVARHMGYETAFLEFDDVSFPLE